MTAVTLRRITGLTLIAFVALAGIFAPWLSAFDPNASGYDILYPASAEHPFGTDDLGRDVFTRVLYGARISLVIGPAAALIVALIGIPIGLVAGYAHGRADQMIVQVIDLFIAIPAFVLALIVMAMIGASLPNLVFVLGLVMWPEMARLVRGQVKSVRERLYIEAADAIGCSRTRILARHIWPNIMHTIAAQLAITVSTAIFTAASLGFLGLGLPPPAADWGGMVQSGFDYLSLNPWLSIAPGCAVAMTVMGFYLLGRTID
ncbi:ABC transporter permease [Salipiger sp. P9]|uniref:ABC transporter permease n=1 Tax=Salipiger pentaromativorans TaxID=2943193 RepID=UPI002157DE9D|nr:ABC transporter permease [Salipiger pentaromativorans]MCR8549234.1 ABC transporter permease [Salipiger pentaromativorans]